MLSYKILLESDSYEKIKSDQGRQGLQDSSLSAGLVCPGPQNKNIVYCCAGMFRRPGDPQEHNYLYAIPAGALLGGFAVGHYAGADRSLINFNY